MVTVMCNVLIERGVYMNLSCIFRDAGSTQSPVPAACIITVFQQGNWEGVRHS